MSPGTKTSTAADAGDDAVDGQRDEPVGRAEHRQQAVRPSASAGR